MLSKCINSLQQKIVWNNVSAVHGIQLRTPVQLGNSANRMVEVQPCIPHALTVVREWAEVEWIERLCLGSAASQTRQSSVWLLTRLLNMTPSRNLINGRAINEIPFTVDMTGPSTVSPPLLWRTEARAGSINWNCSVGPFKQAHQVQSSEWGPSLGMFCFFFVYFRNAASLQPQLVWP